MNVLQSSQRAEGEAGNQLSRIHPYVISVGGNESCVQDFSLSTKRITRKFIFIQALRQILRDLLLMKQLSLIGLMHLFKQIIELCGLHDIIEGAELYPLYS